jgi:hypothetical protein
MKSTPFFVRISMLLAIGMIVNLSACRKKEDADTDTSASKNESTAERYFNELQDLSDQAQTGDLSTFKLSSIEGMLLSNCAVVTFDTLGTVSASNPDTITIDFGTSCLCNDNKTRSGKIIISSTGLYRNEGSVITITPQNYFVNSNQILGTRIVTNIGSNSMGQPTFSVVVNGTIILANNEGTITWNANRTRTWVEGSSTLIFADDVFSITGSSSGTKVNGQTWTSLITTPLVHKRICHQIVSGVLQVTPSNKPQRTLDFGQGNCDNTLTVLINGNTYTVTF